MVKLLTFATHQVYKVTLGKAGELIVDLGLLNHRVEESHFGILF